MYRTNRIFHVFVALCAGMLWVESALAQRWQEPIALSMDAGGASFSRNSPKGIGVGTLSLSSSATPTVVNGFEIVSYTVDINLSGDPDGEPGFVLDGVFNFTDAQTAFADFAPSIQMPVDSFDGSTWTCSNLTGGFTCNPPNGELTEGAHTIVLTVEVLNKGSAGGTLMLSASTPNFSVAPTTSSVVIAGTGDAPLSFTSAFSDTAPAPGDPVDISVTVSNTSPTNFSGDFAIDFDTATPGYNLPTSFSSGGFDCVPGPTGLSCASSFGGLAPGADVTLTLPTIAPNGATPFSADVSLTPFSTDTVISINPQSVAADTSATLQDAVSLVTPQPIAYGDSIVFSGTVSNESGAPGRNVILDLDLVDNQFSGTAAFVSGTGTNWTCVAFGGGSPVRKRNAQKGPSSFVGASCDYGLDLAVGQTTPPVTITFSAPTADGVSSVDATAFGGADNQSNFTSPVPITINVAPAVDLRMSKTASVTSATVGDQFNYSLIVTNDGPGDVDRGALTITDTLPPEVSFVSGPTSPYSCTDSGGGIVVCNYVDSPTLLANGDSDTIDITVMADGPGTVVNSVEVLDASGTIDNNPGNNTATVAVDIAGSADLSLSKTASVSTIGTGGQFAYTLTVNNAGPNAPSVFSITDTLPAQVSFDSFSGPDFTCIESTGTVTCDYTGAPLAIGVATSVDLTVTANTDGTADNTATVALSGADVDPLTSNNSDSASVIVTLPTADLSIAKTASTGVVDVGGTFSYTLAVSNAGPDMASAYTVSDSLPNEVSFDGFTGGDFSCTESAGVVTCDYVGAGLNSGATASVDINVTAQTDGVVSNTATVTLTPPAIDPGTANNSASVDVTINPQADLALSKTASASSVTVGDVFDWIITVSNNGPADADGFTVTDTLPSGTSFNALLAPDFTCTTAGADINCGWTGPSPLIASETSQITVTVNADSPGTANNSASVSAAAGAPDNNLANNSANASVVVNAPPMTTLVTTVVDTPDPVEPDGTFTIAATLLNQGPEIANNLFAVFQLDTGVSFNGTTAVKGGGGWSCTLLSGPDVKSRAKGSVISGNAVDCFNPGPLPVSGTTTVSIDLTAPDVPGIITTGIEVGSDEFGPDILSETTSVGADVDLSVSKLANTDSVDVGQGFNYTISVTNALGTADNILVEDNISPALFVRSVTGQNWACEQLRSNYQCRYSGAPLASGDSTTDLTFEVNALNAAQISNTATVSSGQNDVNPGNNSATAIVTASGEETVDLVLTKASLPETVIAGEQFQYALAVQNVGLSQASGVTVSDQLPAGVQFISGGSVGWTCSSSGGLVQCTRNGVILPNAGTETITLNVRAPTVLGQLQNTADVSSDQQEVNPEDNRATATTSVVSAGPDVAVVKQVDQTAARRNDLLTYTIDVTNMSDEIATGVMVTDVLPTGFALANVTTPNWDCQVTNQSVVCSLMSDLEGGASAGLILTGRVTVSTGLITNRVSVVTASGDPNLENNQSQVDTAVSGDVMPADLTISIDDTVDPVLAEEPFDYLITYGNAGPGTAIDFVITGDIPAGLVVGPVSASDEVSCEVEGQRLVCRSEASLAPDQDRLITLSVTAPSEAGDLSFPVEIQFEGLAIDENGTDNTDVEQTTVRLTPTADELEDQLRTSLGNIDDPLVANNLTPTAELCANPPAGVLDLCRAIADALDDGRTGEVADAIRQIVGAPATTQHTSLIEAGSTQFTNMTNRFNQNRQGQGTANGGTVNIDGLAFRYGNEVLPFSYMQAGESEDPVIDSAGLIKPWAFFINGTISGGDKDPSTREVAFDFDTRGITMGVDYRFSSRLIGGAALGYTDFDSDIQGGGSLESNGVMLHLFGNYYPTNRLFIDGLLSFGSMDFDQRRPIAFSIGDLVIDEMATGSTEADMLSGSLSVGYNYNSGSWNFTPSGSISIMDAEIDAFDESGTSLSLNYAEQDVESMIFSANLSVSKIISLSKGILTPTFDVSYLHESQNDDNNLSTQILGGPAGASFLVEADSPDRNYASAGLGLVFVGANGKQAFLTYRNILGLSGFSRWTVNAGVRFEF
ncbi:MAG: autotransporter domain-containing protein [Lysobacterales bacterium]